LLRLIAMVPGLAPRKRRIDEAPHESGRTRRVSCGDLLGKAVEWLGPPVVPFWRIRLAINSGASDHHKVITDREPTLAYS